VGGDDNGVDDLADVEPEPDTGGGDGGADDPFAGI
jgi:hypothetical protein